MKNQLILGSLLAFATIANAQWTTSGNDVYKTNTAGNTGIGTTTPAHKLDIATTASGGDGIRIQNNGSDGEVTIRMDNNTSGGHEYALFSLGNGNTYPGSFLIHDYTAGAPRFSISSGGNVGIGLDNASYKMELTTSTSNDGISINQSGTSSGSLYLKNSNTGGKNWALFSTGSAHATGAGNLIIHDASGSTDRLFIQGSTGFIGIGTTNPSAKLHATGGATGLQGNGTSGGVAGTGTGSGVAPVSGVSGRASAGTVNYAGWFQATGAGSGINSYGVFAEVTSPTSGGTNYGVYATVGGNNNLGAGPNYAGYFNGDVVTAGGSFYYSDGQIKKNVTSIKSSLSIIEKLNPVNYNFDVEGNKNLALPIEKQYGFISQEVQKILPEFTKTLIHPATLDEQGREIAPKKEVLGLNYQGFIALLTKGIQEQQAQIESQQQQIDEQKQLISELQEKVGITTNLSEVNGIWHLQMSQNEPNPFKEETTVRYSLPQGANIASLMVYDLTGKQIATFPIDHKNASSITITSEKLAAGIYIYSIVADGKIVDTKRMIVAEK